jgi:hypothetical protein
VRIPAGRKDEHRAAHSGFPVGLVEPDVADHEPGEHDEQLGRACVEPRGFELR